jgi:hypothetical protein
LLSASFCLPSVVVLFVCFLLCVSCVLLLGTANICTVSAFADKLLCTFYQSTLLQDLYYYSDINSLELSIRKGLLFLLV